MSYDIVQESVPSFVKRVGDYVVQGSNNAIIILGTDRAKKGPAGLSDGYGHLGSSGKGIGSGAVHIIVGRADPDGNPDLEKDSAYMYLSMKSDPDKNLGLENVEGSVEKSSVAVIKADAVRLVVRKDLKISFEGGSTYIVLKKDEIVVEGKKISLGTGARKHLVRYEDMQQMFDAHIHNSAVGPTSPPLLGAPGSLMKSLEKKISTQFPKEILVSG